MVAGLTLTLWWQAYSSFQLSQVTWIEQVMEAKGRQKMITALTTSPPGRVWAHKQCNQSLWTFPASCTANESKSEHLVDKKTKVIIIPPTRWGSQPKLNVWISAWQQSQRCSQNPCGLFVLVKHYLSSANHTSVSRGYSDPVIRLCTHYHIHCWKAALYNCRPMKMLSTLPWLSSCTDGYMLKLTLVTKLWVL